jgi:4-amino-4-deoxy-L-arabinose transferase-like glycosyltransferase
VERGATHLPPKKKVSRQIATWWHEAEVAIRAGQKARASRYLRWILACSAEEEEAWLWLARLAPNEQAEAAYLRQAYTFFPDSTRVQTYLREARDRQLQATARPLKPRQLVPHCLPNTRQAAHPRRHQRQTATSSNPSGLAQDQAHPVIAMVADRLWPLPTFTFMSRVDLAAWLAFLLPLSVYLLTACTTVYNLDSAEFSAAVHVLGIVRATGYPLYLLLGKAFTLLLPVGDVGFRLNVLSALCAAGTTALLYRFIRRLTRQRAASLAASLLFAFSYYFWAQAVVAEVYTLHTLLMISLFLLLERWTHSLADGLLVAIGLLYGLSFGNHMSTLLLAPGIGLYLLVVAGRDLFRPRRLLLLAGPFLVGLLVYLYLPLRYLADPIFNYAGHFDSTGNFVPLDMTRPQNLWWLITGQGFQKLMFDYGPGELLSELQGVAHRLWGNFLGIGILPGLLGAIIQIRRRPRHLLLLAPIFAANLVFFVNYRIVDKEVMFVPAYLIWTIWIGEGFAWLVHWVQDQRAAASKRAPAWAWVLALLALAALLVNWPLVDVHGDSRARDRAEAILSVAGPDAIVFGWWTSAPPMHYLQIVENRRPDVLVINRFLIGADEMYDLIDRSLGRRPVYTVELDEGLVNVYRAVSLGPMFELMPHQVAGAQP